MKKASNTPTNWSETHLQINIFVWFSNCYPEYHGLLIHVPMGEASGKEGKKAAMMGAIPGVADLLFFVGDPVAIELKRPDGLGTQSKAQKKWEKEWKRMGREYKLYNDMLDVKNFIIKRIENYEWEQNQLNMS